MFWGCPWVGLGGVREVSDWFWGVPGCWGADTDYLKWLFPRHMKSNLYRLCYTPLGQGVSICNYWNGLGYPNLPQGTPKPPPGTPKPPPGTPKSPWHPNPKIFLGTPKPDMGGEPQRP